MKTKVSISKRNLLLFGLPVFGLVLGLLANFALLAPQKSQAQQLESQLQTAQAQLVASKQKPAKTPKPAEAAAPKPQSVQAADIFRLMKAMPDTEDVPGALFTLSQIAQASKVLVVSVTPTAVVPLAQGYSALPVVVDLTGKFSQIAAFLQGLRQQALVGKNGRVSVEGRLFVANNVNITSSDGRTVSATLNLDAFIYSGGTPAAGAPTTTTTTG